jgi:fructose-1-phosphate kinase PfkB-like protein
MQVNPAVDLSTSVGKIFSHETREDLFVGETSTGHQYRFILPGPCLREGEWQECLKLVSSINPFPRFVIASGSLPAGVPDDFYARIARIAMQRCTRSWILRGERSPPRLRRASI